MKSKSPSVDPSVGQAQAGLARTAQAAEDRAALNDAYYREQFMPRYMEQMDRQLALGQAESARQQEMSQYAMGLARKEEGRRDALYGRVDEIDSDANRQRQAGMAIADAEQAISGQRGATMRGLQRIGVNPNSGAYGAALAAQDTNAGLAKVMAANTAREAARREGMNLRFQAAGLGAGGTGQFLGQAGGLGTSSVGVLGSGMDAIGAAGSGWNMNNTGWNNTMGLGANTWGNSGSLGLNVSQFNAKNKTGGFNLGSAVAGGLQGFASGGWWGAAGGALGGGMKGYGMPMGGGG